MSIVGVSLADCNTMNTESSSSTSSNPTPKQNQFTHESDISFTNSSTYMELPALQLHDIMSYQDQLAVMEKASAWPVIKSGYMRKRVVEQSSRRSSVDAVDSANLSHSSGDAHPVSPLARPVSDQWQLFYVQVRGVYMFFYQSLDSERIVQETADQDIVAAGNQTMSINFFSKIFASIKPPSMSSTLQSSFSPEMENNPLDTVKQSTNNEPFSRVLVNYICLSEAILSFASAPSQSSDSVFDSDKHITDCMLLVPKTDEKIGLHPAQVYLNVVVSQNILESQWQLRDTKYQSQTIEEVQEQVRITELCDWTAALGIVGACIDKTEFQKLGRNNTITSSSKPSVSVAISRNNTFPASKATSKSGSSLTQRAIQQRPKFLTSFNKKFSASALSLKNDTDALVLNRNTPPSTPPRISSPQIIDSTLSHLYDGDASPSCVPMFSKFDNKIFKSKKENSVKSPNLEPIPDTAQERIRHFQKLFEEYDVQPVIKTNSSLISNPTHTSNRSNLPFSIPPAPISPSSSSESSTSYIQQIQSKPQKIQTKSDSKIQLKKHWQRLWSRSFLNDTFNIELAADYADRIVPTEPSILIRKSSIQFENASTLSPRGRETLHLVPRALLMCITAIEDLGMDTAGIYRISGVTSNVAYLQAQFSRGLITSLMLPFEKVAESSQNLKQKYTQSSILTKSLTKYVATDINKLVFNDDQSAFTAECDESKSEQSVTDSSVFEQKQYIPASNQRQTLYNTILYNNDIHVITTVVKNILRAGLGKYCEPVYTFSHYNLFLKASQIEDPMMRLVAIQDVVHMLPDLHFATLDLVCKHLANVVSRSDLTCMSSRNLSIVFGPTLFCEPYDYRFDHSQKKHAQKVMKNMPIQCAIVQSCIEYAEWMFDPKVFRPSVVSESSLVGAMILPPTMKEVYF
ncbi:hypothetical protein O5D80_000343 [Batrachochytrium dendrobatidis]|nr:hypothetical protein O5D80_000343 [Batrachochytrium dendrobatidis]